LRRRVRLRAAARAAALAALLALGYVALGGPLLAVSVRGLTWGKFSVELLSFNANGTTRVEALELVYTPCSPSSCSPRSPAGTLRLAPSPGASTPPTWGLLDTVYLRLGTGDEVPPTLMWAPSPGVLNATWIYYPLVRGTALLRVETSEPRVLAKTCPGSPLLEAMRVPSGCLVEPHNPAPGLLELRSRATYGSGGRLSVEASASLPLRAAAAAALLASLYAALSRRRLRR